MLPLREGSRTSNPDPRLSSKFRASRSVISEYSNIPEVLSNSELEYQYQ
jgi:hypothetical protein